MSPKDHLKVIRGYFWCIFGLKPHLDINLKSKPILMFYLENSDYLLYNNGIVFKIMTVSL